MISSMDCSLWFSLDLFFSFWFFVTVENGVLFGCWGRCGRRNILEMIFFVAHTSLDFKLYFGDSSMFWKSTTSLATC